MESGTEIFAELAVMYAKETVCDKAEAQQATFVAATLLADMFGKKEIGDYFSKRASEMENEKTGETWKECESEISFDEPAQVTNLVPANETNVKQAYYQNSYWI